MSIELENMKNAQRLRIQFSQLFSQSDKIFRRPGIEPGSTWKAAMLTLYHRRFDAEIH